MKRIAFFLFSLTFTVCAFAQTVSVGNASAQCGQSATVPVSIASADGLLSLEFRVAFDASRVTPTAVTAGTLTSGFALSSHVSGGVISVAMASGTPVSGGGTVANISFSVAADATGSAPLTISHVLVNDIARAGNSGALTLSCARPPGPPALTAPTNGATGVEAPVTLRWNAGAEAATYNVYFGTSRQTSLATRTSRATYAVATEPGTTYYWSVESVNTAGRASSATFSFTTAGTACSTPAAPDLHGPARVTSNEAFELTWNAVAGATQYIVSESENDSITTADTHLTLTRTAASERTLSFRVHARNAAAPCNVDGPASAVVAVTIVPRPALPAGTRVIPAVASAEGTLGSFFRTAVQLHNAGSARITGRLVFHAAGTEGGLADPSLAYALDPGETKSYDDIVTAIGVARGLGSLDLIPDAGSAAPLSVVRIYNDAGALGTSGTTLDSLELGDAIAEGQRGILVAPMAPSRSRMNLGIRTLLDGASMTITVRDRHGATIQSSRVSYPPTYFVQLPLSEFTGGAVLLGDEVIVIEVEHGTAMVYGSTTDNVTQDPSVQIARP